MKPVGIEGCTGSLNHTLFGQTGSLTGIAWATITTKPLNGPKPIVRQKACILNRGYLLAVSYVGQSAHRWQLSGTVATRSSLPPGLYCEFSVGGLHEIRLRMILIEGTVGIANAYIADATTSEAGHFLSITTRLRNGLLYILFCNISATVKVVVLRESRTVFRPVPSIRRCLITCSTLVQLPCRSVALCQPCQAHTIFRRRACTSPTCASSRLYSRRSMCLSVWGCSIVLKPCLRLRQATPGGAFLDSELDIRHR